MIPSRSALYGSFKKRDAMYKRTDSRRVGRLFVIEEINGGFRICRSDGRPATIDAPFATREAAVRKAAAMQNILRRCAYHQFHAGEHLFVRTTSQILLSGECPAMEVL